MLARSVLDGAGGQKTVRQKRDRSTPDPKHLCERLLRDAERIPGTITAFEQASGKSLFHAMDRIAACCLERLLHLKRIAADH
jgi:hypothetical protein